VSRPAKPQPFRDDLAALAHQVDLLRRENAELRARPHTRADWIQAALVSLIVLSAATLVYLLVATG
jgi:hypothetical protein